MTRVRHKYDLLPCPFCGYGADVKTLPDGVYYVQCNACGAATDQAEEEMVAIYLWNQRVES